MRVRWVLVLLALSLLAAPAASVPTLEEVRGGVDPRVPDDVYHDGNPGPVVEFPNDTVEVANVHPLEVGVSFRDGKFNATVEVTMEIYQWAVFEKEEALDELTEPPPVFRYFDPEANRTVESLTYGSNITEPDVAGGARVQVNVVVPAETREGHYRIRMMLEWLDGSAMKVAYSWGHHTPASWEDSIRSIRDDGSPTKGDYIISEGGVTAVPTDFDYVSRPSNVPDFGDFSTPVIRPGQSGGYGFTVTNRYDMPMVDVRVTIEFYMWATIEDARPIEDIQGTPPKVKGEGKPKVERRLGDIEKDGSVEIDIKITTSDDTDKGTYFVRHDIAFTYNGTRFNMSSRGFFTFEQWEGFDYSNLYYQLGVAGIVPDSSFSVKDPVPLWPLATLITLCVLFGVLAVVFYLAEEHGDQYPRLKKGLQAITGRWEQRKRLMRQRLEELRQEDWEMEERRETEGEAEP